MSGADETATKRLIRQQMGHVACTHKCRCNNQGLVQHAKHCQQQLAVIQAKHKKNEQVIKKEELEDGIMEPSTLMDEFTISRKTSTSAGRTEVSRYIFGVDCFG